MYHPQQRYPSARSPVAADNLVATSQPLATEAGLQALRQGGNAIDAALAAAITLTVVEPNNNGLGSDAFVLLWDGAHRHIYQVALIFDEFHSVLSQEPVFCV